MFGQRLVEIATSFPTAVYSVGFGVALVYWVFVTVGALEMPGAHADGADLDLEGLGGAGKLDVDLSPLDVDAGGVGKLDAGALAAAKGSAAFVRHEARRVKVPLTARASIAVTLTWMFSCLGIELLDALGTDHLALRALVGVVAPLLGLLVMRPLTRPLGKLFGVHRGPRSRELRGKTALVTTGRVDRRFGQARVEGVNAELLVQVRAEPERKIGRGDRVLLLDFDEQASAFDVESLSHVLEGEMIDTELVPSEAEPQLRAGTSRNE